MVAEFSGRIHVKHKRRFKIGTLVRDKMPERIEKLGGYVNFQHLDADGYLQHLRLKLKEEAEELCKAATPKEIQEEIADVLEVLQAFAKKNGLKWVHIEKKRLQKRDERGGFKRGTFVEFVEVEAFDDSHPIVQYCLANPEDYPEIL